MDYLLAPPECVPKNGNNICIKVYFPSLTLVIKA